MTQKVLVVTLIVLIVAVMVTPSMLAKPVYAPRPPPPIILIETETGSLEGFRPTGLHVEFPSEPQHEHP